MSNVFSPSINNSNSEGLNNLNVCPSTTVQNPNANEENVAATNSFMYQSKDRKLLAHT